MFEAQRLWNFRIGAFEDHFRYQYALSETPEPIEGFQRFQCGGWHLHVGSALPCVALTDANGAVIGFCIGIAVDEQGLIHGATASLPLAQKDKDFWDAFEQYITNVAGRFAFIICRQNEVRLYTDPIGMIGAVYNAEDRFAAASTLLAIKRPLLANPKFDLDRATKAGGKIPLFHTADAHVKRLNPNYYLDLTTFTSHRFWPRVEDFATPPSDPLTSYAEISNRAAFNISHIAKAYPCAMPVTGGQDSRLLLAFAKDHRDEINSFYAHCNNYASRRDAIIGGALCKTVSVPFTKYEKPEKPLSPRQLRLRTRAFELTSGCGATLPREYRDDVVGVPDGHVILRGHLTDLLRAVYVFKGKRHWHKSDWQIERLLIVPRNEFTSDVADAFRDDFQKWQASLPDNAKDKAVDFMFLELYYNATVGVSFPALWKNFYLSPFNSRKLIALSLQFAESNRRKSEPVFDLIETVEPALSNVPFDFEWSGPLDQDGVSSVLFETQTSERRKRTRERLEQYKAQNTAQSLPA